MNLKQAKVKVALVAALIISSAAILTLGGTGPARDAMPTRPQDPKANSRQSGQETPRREENKRPPDRTRYSYEFTQPQFYTSHIVIEHDAAGLGKVTFERPSAGAPIEEPVELSTSATGRILALWSELNFLDSKEDYQAAKQFPHLGTMRLHMDSGDRKRTAEFNWTNNKTAGALVNEYRRVADQAMFVFDMKVARENQPLNAPKLMEQLESMLTHGGLSDPFQLVPLLHELTTDEHIPLIARNHAARLLKRIEK